MPTHSQKRTGPKTARPARKTDDGKSPLNSYMRDVARGEVLSAEDEKRLATRIADLTRGHWRALLGYPPFIPGIVDQILKALGEGATGDEQNEGRPKGAPVDLLESLRRTSRAYRDRETRSNKDAYEAARDAAASAMAIADVDGEVADRLMADLDAVDAGRRESVTIKITFPPKRSRPFSDYHQKVRNTGTAMRYAKHAFVKANLRLVISIANRFDYGLLPLQDLIQEGNVGLLKAVDRFDVERGFRFSTYASWWIRHAINRAIANKGRTVRLPAHVTADQQKLARATREFETAEGRKPSSGDLAGLTGLAEVRVKKLRKIPLEPAVSLDLPLGEGDSRSMLDLVADPNSDAAAEQLEADDMQAVLRDLLSELAPIEVDILTNRFGLDNDGDVLTLRELGERHSLSRERIRQLQERALSKLRREFERRALV